MKVLYLLRKCNTKCIFLRIYMLHLFINLHANTVPMDCWVSLFVFYNGRFKCLANGINHAFKCLFYIDLMPVSVVWHGLPPDADNLAQ